MGALRDTGFFVLFLGVLVTVHELGHFLVAKWAGVKVLKFSIGFGPKIFGFRRGETEYQVAWIPLGGYVRMAGEIPGDDVPEEDVKRSFNAAPWWKRALIVVAGPVFNLLFPIVALFFVFLGTHEGTVAWVGSVERGSAAEVAGIRPGDVIVSVDGKKIDAFVEIAPALENVYDRDVQVVIQRDGTPMTFAVRPRLQEDIEVSGTTRRGLLGVSSLARPAVVGVAPGSAAEKAGLEAFDRIVSVNGKPVSDEIALLRVLGEAQGTLEVVAVRSAPFAVGGATMVAPRVVKATLEKQDAPGLAALGAESGDLAVWTVLPNGHAERLGVARGDRLLAVDGQPLGSWGHFLGVVGAAQIRAVKVRWRHGAEEKEAALGPLTPEALGNKRFCFEPFDFGVRPRAAFLPGGEVVAQTQKPPTMKVHLDALGAFKAAVGEVPEAVRLVAGIMKKLATLEVPIEAVGGPIQLFDLAARSAEAGPRVFLERMALISVNLGLVNLLPIPILDGFGLLAALWEGVRRRPIPLRAREIANMVGLAILAGLVVLVFRNDISRLLFC